MAVIRWGMVAIASCFATGLALAATQATAPSQVLDSPAQGSELLADDGRKLVFGDGNEHAIRIHDAQGRLVRERHLADFLPAAYVHSLPRGEQGLQWLRQAKLVQGQDRVEFSVLVPGSAPGATGPALIFSIDLRDGGVSTAQIREYVAALDHARALEARVALSR